MDVIITIPKSISWEQYQKELDVVSDGSQNLNFKVPHLPKHIKIRDKCYLVYNGEMIGYMFISGLESKGFRCN